MHRPAHGLIAAKREGDVRKPAGDVTTRAGRADLARGLNEVERIGVVLLDPGRDGEDVRIEDDVLGRETDGFGQDAKGALADLHLARGGIGLAGLVEGHHHDRRAI